MKTADASGTRKAGAAGRNPEYFVVIDLHKKFVRVVIMGLGGRVIQNKRMECDHRNVARVFSKVSAGARYVWSHPPRGTACTGFSGSWDWTVLLNLLATK